MSNRLEKVKDLAKQAGRIALQMRPGIHPSLKSDGSFVTEADMAVEAFLKERLAAEFPDYDFLGEEQRDGTSPDPDSDHPVWVVDPIDGTDAYRTGLPHFCVSVGLFEKGRYVLGVVYLPQLDEMYAVDEGQKPTFNDEEICVTPETKLDGNSFLISSSNFHRKYSTTFPGKIRSLGSSAYHMCLVARGSAVGAIFTAYIWDIAAGVALVEAAGGRIGFSDGSQIDWRQHLNPQLLPQGLVVSPPQLFDKLKNSIALRNK